MAAPAKARRQCPYLGTVNRHLLDFDFEKLCSITMSNQHVYCCLVCGKYFQGRGKNTHAYTHSLEERHYVYINLHDCKVYCLPDNYEVEDASLNDIKYYLNPTFHSDEVRALGTKVVYGKALDGQDFIPGCVGLNNLKQTDYFNVVIQALCMVAPLRNTLLLMDFNKIQKPDPVLRSFSELVRKIFNPKNFKGLVSPHEFLQAVGVQSEKKFKIGEQKDPLALLSWLLLRLHQRLAKKHKQGTGSVIHDCFQGELLIKSSLANDPEKEPTEAKSPFLYLTLDVPPAPIFKDSLDRNMIPHIPIFDLLQKFDGESIHEPAPNQLKRYSLWRLPPYLLVNVKRFSKNNFFVEKNPTIVTFPVKNLDLREYVHPEAPPELNPLVRYDLVANVCHEGRPKDGRYKVHVLHAATSQWYEIEDLRVTAVLPQLVAVAESYIQVYQRQDVKPDGTLDGALRTQAFSSIYEMKAEAPDEMEVEGVERRGVKREAEDELDMFS